MAAAGGDKHPVRTLQCLGHLPYLHLNALVTSKNHCLLAREWSASVQFRKPTSEGKHEGAAHRRRWPARAGPAPAGGCWVELIATSRSGDGEAVWGLAAPGSHWQAGLHVCHGLQLTVYGCAPRLAPNPADRSAHWHPERQSQRALYLPAPER
jgi:hypothetical protein